MKRIVINRKLITLIISFAFITSTVLILSTTALAMTYASPGNPVETEDSLGQGIGIEKVKRAIADYAAGCVQECSAYDVASYINDHNMDYGASSI